MILFLKRLFRIVTVECKDCHYHNNGFCKKIQKLDRSHEEWLKTKDSGFFDCGIEEARREGNCGKSGYRDWETDRKSTRLNSSHRSLSRMPSSA